MIRLLAVALLAAAVAAAPAAAADPQILVPDCTGGQVAQAGECNASPMEGWFGDAAGANPNVPLGLTPDHLAVVAPLGLTPQNLPVTMPLGVTPPNVSRR